MARSYTTADDTRAKLGLIALQADRTIEDDFRRLMPRDVSLLVSRVPSGLDVTLDSLAEMESALSGAASLFPVGHRFDVVGYGCTSGTAQIGAPVIAQQVQAGTETGAVSEPVTALIAACHALKVSRIAILSPYVASVSNRLREVLAAAGITTPTFASFDEGNEAAVAHIDEDSITRASIDMMKDTEVEALFLSCTNLRTLGVIAGLQDELGVPVLSSNLVLAWHMLNCAGLDVARPRDLL
ncbi:Asp/Glu racemase [uncultured Tateyamaria sp.]|uniref:maleate cis-trans isomerase family protein n=1 Tax=uncultured Tateyamaria sp. TaxID=455651 RepID=UPI00260FFAF2|nr:Asp/Glu racemase [uncultured Tateyamaria sp.]